MANGRINFGKQSGGTLGLVFPDGVSNTEVVLPESGELVTKAYADTRDAQNVKLTGDQTITGVKTFSSSPIVPTPTAGDQVANKNYADLKVALTEFIGTNQNLSGSGYQKLPGGLIVQWTKVIATPSGVTVTLPIAFPNQLMIEYATCSNGSSISGTSSLKIGLTGIIVYSNISIVGVNILAIGY